MIKENTRNCVNKREYTKYIKIIEELDSAMPLSYNEISCRDTRKRTIETGDKI